MVLHFFQVRSGLDPLALLPLPLDSGSSQALIFVDDVFPGPKKQAVGGHLTQTPEKIVLLRPVVAFYTLFTMNGKVCLTQ